MNIPINIKKTTRFKLCSLHNVIIIFHTIFISLLYNLAYAGDELNSNPNAHRKTSNFLFVGGEHNLTQYKNLLINNNLDGVQVIYTWKQLEPQFNKYDFSLISQDLTYLNSIHKKLFIQIQDRFFTPNARNIPSYLLTNPVYAGGLVAQMDNPGEHKKQVQGWVSINWNNKVAQRFHSLIINLARNFDGKVYGINLAETAIDINMKADKTGFSCDKYFNAEINTLKLTKQYFTHSYVVQFVNFFPCEWDNDHNYMGRLFKLAQSDNIGLGGPDVVPYQKAQMKNSYQFFNQYKNNLVLVAMAIQSPDLTYINPITHKSFTKQELTNFALNYLGATIIFWDTRYFKE